jgi:beta-ribofuranosylaminobenzene 5'-phosphate synthase
MTERDTFPHGSVTVDAPARVHLGMLDLGGSLGRHFGGIGVGVQPPAVRLTASGAHDIVVVADAGQIDASSTVDEARGVAAHAVERVLRHYRITERAHIRLHQVLPAHRGLGSGTQVALAAARAVAHLYGLPCDARGLAVILGRARRSAIGTYVFEHGGFIVEGGRQPGVDRPAPLLARLSIPEPWRCVLALPPAEPGLSGAAEATAFATLPVPPVHEAERVAHLVLMALLPALADGDLAGFGEALSEIQAINGRWFSAAQGGAYAGGPSTAIVECLTAWGAPGVGQSSWGPAVYAIAPDPDASAALMRRLATRFPSAILFESGFSAVGARIEATT